MTCRELVDFIERYRSGELDRAARKRFDAHLAVCPECVDYLESYETTVRMGRGAYAGEPPPEVPAALAAAILDAIDAD